MKYILVLFSVLFIGEGISFAACHTVIPGVGGTHTGVDWNTAFSSIPATLTRGDIYYLADGNYGSYTFNQSGSTTVEIRKAQTYDHCTDTGWNAGTMGAGQAVFSNNRMFEIESTGLIINGNGQQTTPGCGGAVGNNPALSPANPKDCGIKIDNSSCSSNTPNACSDLVSDGGVLSGGYTLKYVEILGSGRATPENYLIRADGSNGTVLNHMYAHSYGSVFVVAGGTNNLEMSYNYLWRNQIIVGSNPAHGQGIEVGGGASNGTVHRNIYRDLGGTSIFIAYVSGGTSTGWKFYDNIVWNTQGFTPNFPSANGLIACINGSVCNSTTLINNTVAGMTAGAVVGILSEANGSYTVQNNIWYSNGQMPTLSGGGTYTQNHNSFLNSGTSCPSGTANVCDNASANPFTNWPAGNFALASDAANWNNRQSLASPYDTDLAGIAYTTDRGAYQFVGNSPVVQLSPTSLNFGSVGIGTTSSPQSVTLTNTGTATLNIASITPSGDYALATNFCGSTLGASLSCNFTVAFSPTQIGTRTGAITIVDNASGSPHTVPLTGIGAPPTASLTPNPLNFGTQTVGSTSTPRTATLTNTGAGLLTLNCGGCGLGISNSSIFPFVDTTCGISLAPGTSCTVRIAFSPPNTGTFNGTLTATNDAANSPEVITLTGVGNIAHWRMGRAGSGAMRIGRNAGLPSPLAYSARTDNCTTGAELGCIVGRTTGQAGSPLSFLYRSFDTAPFPANNCTTGVESSCANNSAVDPDFGSYMVMVTDQRSRTATTTFNMGSNGEKDWFNTDSTMFLVHTNGGGGTLYKIDKQKFQAHTCSPANPCLIESRITSGATDNTHLIQGAGWSFSRKNGESNVLLEKDTTNVAVNKLVIDSSGDPATQWTLTRTIYVDFDSDGPGGSIPCSVLPSNYTAGWTGVFDTGNDGAVTIAFGGGPPWPGAGIAVTTSGLDANHTYIYPTVNNSGHRGFQATTGGTTGGTEPNWAATCNTAGQTCTDGSVVWTNIGNLNSQGNGFDIVNYRPGIGCSRLNTRTGRVTRGTGVTDPAGLITTMDDNVCLRMGQAAPCPLSDRFTLHEAGQPFDSTYATISPDGAGSSGFLAPGISSCAPTGVNYLGLWSSSTAYVNKDWVYYNTIPYQSGTSNTNSQPDTHPFDWIRADAYCYNYVWKVPSTIVNPCIGEGTGSACSGHGEKGYATFYKGKKAISHYFSLPSINRIANPGFQMLSSELPGDHHGSGRNEDGSDSRPFLYFQTDVPTDPSRYTVPYYAEIIGVTTDGLQTTYRFAHNYSTGSESEFSAQNAIGLISQDGQFAAVGTDMMGRRGNLDGTLTCNNLRANYGPAKGQAVNSGDKVLPTSSNTQSIFQAQNSGTEDPTTLPNWDVSCPNVNDTCIDNTVTWKNLGPNNCRADILMIDLLSAHPLP